MGKRKLGDTGLAVTGLGYGAWELRHLELTDASRILNTALDAGINYIDTSPDYGLSEQYIGAAISNRRDEFYLATKCGCNVDQAGKRLNPSHVWNYSQLMVNIENSLRILKTDHIDVWQLHGAQPEDLLEGKNDETIKAMQILKQQGKIRFLGVSFKNGAPTDKLYPAGFGFIAIKEYIQWGIFDVIQVVYGGLTRQNEILISQASECGVGIIVRGVLRKYCNNYNELFDLSKLDQLLEENETRNDFLIRFALTHESIGSMIIGTKRFLAVSSG